MALLHQQQHHRGLRIGTASHGRPCPTHTLVKGTHTRCPRHASLILPSLTGTASASGHAAACPEAQWATVAAPSTQASTASGAGCLVRSRVIKNRKGLFRIRHLQEADLYAVAQLQAASFHESPPLKALDGLAYTLFKAEVLSAVQKKTAVLADDGFAMLVAESCSPAGLPPPQPHHLGHASPSSSSSSPSGGSEALAQPAVWFGDQRAGGQPQPQQQQQQPQQQQQQQPPSARAADAAASNRILGVIEVGMQDEPDVLQHLPAGTSSYAYISSMAVAPHLRRCGLGAALLQAAEQQAALWGQPLVALHVYATNTAAIRLYERHGLSCEARDPSWRQLVGGKVRQLHVKYL